MLHYFTFNGQDSREFDLYIKDKTAYNKPERNIEFIPVPGRVGDLIVDNGGFKNLKVKYDLRLIAPKITGDNTLDFTRAYYLVADWLQPTDNYFVLTDSYNPDYYRQACLLSSIELSASKVHPVADFSVIFNCKPYMYSNEGNKKITVTESGYVNNPENATSAPLIRVYTNSTYRNLTDEEKANTYIWFAARGGTEAGAKQYKIYNVGNYVDIDSDMMNVYSGAINKNNDYGSAEFPTLKPGLNTITIGQYVDKIEIIPRWRAL